MHLDHRFRELGEVLLRDRLEPLEPPRAGELLAGDLQGRVHDLALLRRAGDPDAPPLVVALAFGPDARRPDALLQRADGLGRRELDPLRLCLTLRHREDHLRRPEGDPPRAHRLAEERPRPELAREPGEAERSARLDVQDLPRVVAEPEAELGEPVAELQRSEPVGDREVERRACAGRLREPPLALVGLPLAAAKPLPELRPRQRPELHRRRREARAVLVGRLAGQQDRGKGGAHDRKIARRSDRSGRSPRPLWPQRTPLPVTYQAIASVPRAGAAARASRSGPSTIDGRLQMPPPAGAPTSIPDPRLGVNRAIASRCGIASSFAILL